MYLANSVGGFKERIGQAEKMTPKARGVKEKAKQPPFATT